MSGGSSQGRGPGAEAGQRPGPQWGGRRGGAGTGPSALLLTCVFAESSATRGLPPAGRVAVPAG